MRARLLAIVAVLTGCNQVFGLDGTQPAPDAPAADALPTSCRVTAPLECYAATFLADATSHGKETELITNSQHPALFKFGVDGILPGEHIAAAILGVSPVTKCGMTACTPCPTGATTYQVYWSFDDWVEDQATDNLSSDGTPWELPFASGATDRSALLVDAPLPAAAQLALRVPMTGVATIPAERWIGTHGSMPYQRLSLQLRTNDWAAFASDDYDESTCMEAAGLPSLVLTLCQ